MKRNWTAYPGVFWIPSIAIGTKKPIDAHLISSGRRIARPRARAKAKPGRKGFSPGEPEKIFYIKYRRNGRAIEEKAGRQFEDGMTPAKAAALRVQRIRGDLSNRERRELLKREAERLKEIPPKRWTLERVFDEYIAANPHLKGTPQDRSHFKNLEPISNKEPQEVTPEEIQRIRNDILRTKSPQTCKLTLAILRRIVRWGFKMGYCRPLSFPLDIPPVNNTVTELLTPPQLKRLLNVIDREPRNPGAAMMKLVLFSGLRRGELFRLKWEDIDFNHRFIRLRDPKGGKDQNIPLNPEARKILEKQIQDGAYVFPGTNGNQRVEIRRAVNRIKRLAGLPKDFRPLHGLRHTYASLLASSGKVDLYTLQKLLTHKSPQMTQRYAHLRDQTLKQASNLIGELVTRPKRK